MKRLMAWASSFNQDGTEYASLCDKLHSLDEAYCVDIKFSMHRF